MLYTNHHLLVFHIYINWSANFTQSTYSNVEKCGILRRSVQRWKLQHAVGTAVAIKQTDGHRWCSGEKLEQYTLNFPLILTQFLIIKTKINDVSWGAQSILGNKNQI